MSELDKKIREAWTPDMLPAHMMSLRDWFAGQALSGLAGGDFTYLKAVEHALKHADAMLEAREVRDDPGD